MGARFGGKMIRELKKENNTINNINNVRSPIVRTMGARFGWSGVGWSDDLRIKKEDKKKKS